MEQFDLIDEHDTVVGVTDKPTAHAKKQPHRVAAVFVFDESGHLYVQVHKASGGLYDHSVGGHVHKGEAYAAAASREAVEELGIEQPLTYVTKLLSDSGAYLHMVSLYECTADSSWTFVPNDEVEEIILMSLGDIRSRMQSEPEKFTGDFKRTLEAYCKIKNL